jgi:hypothetical protein
MFDANLLSISSQTPSQRDVYLSIICAIFLFLYLFLKACCFGMCWLWETACSSVSTRTLRQNPEKPRTNYRFHLKHHFTNFHFPRKYLYAACTLYRAEWSVFLTQYCAGGKIEKNEMGGACGAYGRGERCAQGVGGETWGKEVIRDTQT